MIPVIYFFKILLFIFREEEGTEKERKKNNDVREKHQSVDSSARNPGKCPDWEPNW